MEKTLRKQSKTPKGSCEKSWESLRGQVYLARWSALWETVCKTWRPPPRLDVVEHADRYDFLSPEASSEPGRWRTERNPVMWGVMRALTEPGVQEVAVRSCSQIGKTEFLLRIISFFAHQDPSPILVVQPTIEMAEAFSRERLAPLIRDTPVLRGLFPDPKSRNSGNTLRHKEFPGGYVQMVGANSPAGLAMRPIRIVLFDEVDRFPESAGAEGDVISIAKKRTTTFWNRLIIAISSPTETGVSRIEQAEGETDKRRYHVACPHCAHEQALTWAHVTIPKEGTAKRPEKAYIECESCHEPWSEPQRQAAIRGAMRTGWRPTAEAKRPGIIGFHVSELHSLWRTPAEIAIDFMAAQGDTEKLRAWTNTSLGEPYHVEADEISAEGLYARREHYPHEIPNGSHLTAAVDVQGDRLELELVSWGEREECWAIDYAILRGQATNHRTWDQLEQYIQRARYRIDGRLMDVSLVCIDSGAYTDEVYKFCRRNPRKYIPTKGSSEAGKPVANFPRVPNAQKVYLTILGADTIKTLLLDSLSLRQPGAGYSHWPVKTCFDSEYFQQLGAEKREHRFKRGHRVYTWIKTRHRNEALDCRVGNIAAVRLLQQVARITLSSVQSEPVLPVSESPQGKPAMPASQRADRLGRGTSKTPRRHPSRRGLFD